MTDPICATNVYWLYIAKIGPISGSCLFITAISLILIGYWIAKFGWYYGSFLSALVLLPLLLAGIAGYFIGRGFLANG